MSWSVECHEQALANTCKHSRGLASPRKCLRVLMILPLRGEAGAKALASTSKHSQALASTRESPRVLACAFDPPPERGGWGRRSLGIMGHMLKYEKQPLFYCCHTHFLPFARNGLFWGFGHMCPNPVSQPPIIIISDFLKIWSGKKWQNLLH